jgi:uncharacterized membrane protein YcfT
LEHGKRWKTMAMTDIAPEKLRVDWVDFAKGICIVLVVLMHSTLGVEKAMGQEGALNAFIHWAQPFRMPDFFLISGLFLARRIAAPWRDYLDKKVVHFLYFYFLWMTLQLLFKGPGIVRESGADGLASEFALAFLEPFGTLWFIYLLPVFFLVTRWTRALPPIVVFLIAAILEMAPIHTGWIMIDEFAARFVYFFAGYWLAPHVFRFASGMSCLSTPALLSALFVWGYAHTLAFQNGYVTGAGWGIVAGFIGVGAVISAGVLLSRFQAGKALRYLGENSIVVYLSFFLFMAVTRTLSLKLFPQWGPDAISLASTVAGVTGPVILFHLTRNTPLAFLFRRPQWARLASRPKLESASKVWHSGGHEQHAKHTGAGS